MKSFKKFVQEESEQLDELSPNTLHSYIKKSAGNMAGNAALAAAQASSSMRKSSPEVKRNIKNRMKGITSASGRLADKANMAEEVELDEASNLRITKVYNKKNATYAVHTSDRKYYKEFDNEADAKKHLESKKS